MSVSDALQHFNDAIQQYSDDASVAFGIARATIQSTHPDLPSANETADHKATREAAEQKLKRAQGQLASALLQLSQAAGMESDQQGREGYTAVVKLMTSTAHTAAIVCGRLEILTVLDPPTTTQYQNITALVAVLEALAHLSPMSVWQKAPVLGGGQS